MPLLRTERLTLRELSHSDDRFMLQLLNEPAFLRFSAVTFGALLQKQWTHPVLKELLFLPRIREDRQWKTTQQ